MGDTVDAIKDGLELFVIGRPEWQTAQVWKLFESIHVLSADRRQDIEEQTDERDIRLTLTSHSEDAAVVRLHANHNRHEHAGSRFALRTDSATILRDGFEFYDADP